MQQKAAGRALMAPLLPIVGVGHMAAGTGAGALRRAAASGLGLTCKLLVSVRGVLPGLHGVGGPLLLPGKPGRSPLQKAALGTCELCCFPDEKFKLERA